MFFKVKNYAELQDALEGLTVFLTERQVSSDALFASKLVACELLGNVLKHAKEETAVRCILEEGFVELKIFSSKAFRLPETVVCSDTRSENGRGLFLVNEICQGQVFSETDGIRVRIAALVK